MENGQVKRLVPTWLKWAIRIILSYLILLASVLAVTIITILITFSFIVIDGMTDSRSLGAFSEERLVPVSEFFWKLFTWLVPGL
ncbi:hypothetical protein [Halalkalibacter urbisdiaboli]|uniref:hypothetical protein n=1 Tax=Halalkalibacter urbisdiaboli TaxID=1960589 RepID=UPI001FDA0518|nr:hypothetical protein [Halalkalibacter urbisdiaboli]